MLTRSLLVAGLALVLLAPSALADNGGRGRRHARGADEDRRAPAAVVASSQASHDQQAATLVRASGLASEGASDPNVAVTVPGASSSSPATVCASLPSVWAAPLSGSRWDSNVADCANNPAASGSFTYMLTFTLGSAATTPRLLGQVLADDCVTIQLSGHTLAAGGGLSTPMSFDTTDASLFQAGSNTVQFVVTNAGGPTGLDFRAELSAGGVALGPGTTRNHGQCVSEVAHTTDAGPDHGEAVSDAAHDCDD